MVCIVVPYVGMMVHKKKEKVVEKNGKEIYGKAYREIL